MTAGSGRPAGLILAGALVEGSMSRAGNIRHACFSAVKCQKLPAGSPDELCTRKTHVTVKDLLLPLGPETLVQDDGH